MRRFLSFLAALLVTSSAHAHVSAVPFAEIGSLKDAHKAAFSIVQTYLPPANPQITCNLVTGVASVGGPCTSGATCDGVANAAPAFWAFRTWALANQGSSNQVVLTIPNGSDCLFNTNAGTVGGRLSGVQNTFTAGINNLLVNGTGAILRQGAASYWLGTAGHCQAGLASASGCSARIQSVSPGSTTVTLTAASLAAGYVSRFAAGDWIMIGGLDVQGQWGFAIGFPVNQTYFEWRQITNVNAGTGVITLDRPVSNTYLDTWPNYNAGTNFEADNGGPATIWTVGGGVANSTWNTTLEFVGLTFYRSGQIYTNGRNVTFRDVTFPTGTGLGAIPTQNETFTAINTTWNAVIEVDKLIGTFTLDSSSLTLLQFQSNSTDLFIARNGTTFSTGLHGGGKRSELTDVTIADFRPGSYAYGNTPGPVICTRCDVASWVNGGIFQNTNPSPYSMASGVISFPNTEAIGSGPAQRWASTIGKTIFFTATGFNSVGVFTVLGVTQDPTNTYIQTDQAGGFPNYATLGGGTQPFFAANGAQQFTCDACTGDASFAAMNVQAGATPLAPMMTYSQRSFTPTTSPTNLGSNALRSVGKLVSLTVDVTTAFAGTGTATLNPTGQFINTTINQSTWTTFNWFPTINLKQAGTRVITPGGVTCNGSPGACAGDTINSTNGYPPNAVWIQGGLTPWTAGNFSGMTTPPTFTMTIRTDQTP